jgi:bifunctional non-homologous end joining protein LigD
VVPPLESYKKKRDPKKTPEPFGAKRGRGRAKDKPIFVVQRHDARRLHYDFRLEEKGVLLSWAVPKGVPMRRGDRRLAVHVEDHPLDYAAFEGEIPAGEYGAGSVEIWDTGTYDLVERKRDGGLTVELHGSRLNGLWTLIPARMDGDPKNWLLVRKDGSEAGNGRVPRPMLAQLAETPPQGDGWLHEVKLDGFRAIATVHAGEATLCSRNGNDLTERFAEVARALPGALRSADCIVDGEVCALDKDGHARFSLLQRGEGSLVVYLFDILELDGEDVTGRPLVERRRILEQALIPGDSVVRLSVAFEDGRALLGQVRVLGMEGIVSKRAQSLYQPGKRGGAWLKVKSRNRQEFVIAGYTLGKGRRSRGIGALILAVERDGELVYVGNCGTGFDDKELDRLQELLDPLRRDTCPLGEAPRMPRVRTTDVIWVEPKLVCEVEFAEWTSDERLRAPVYMGLRDDKAASDVHRERPVKTSAAKGRPEPPLSNLDKVFWPDEKITKGDLIDYYRRVAEVLVPHLRDRPFTMKRYPDGISGGHFFQKDAPKHMPDWIPTAAFPATSRDDKRKRMINYPLVNEPAALVWMANMGCIDMNAWYARVDKPERPDFVLLDLDPTPEVGFAGAVEAAQLVKVALDAVGLRGYAKTSGADGIHVLVPLVRRYGYDDSRKLSATLARALADAHPGLITTEWSKARRRGVLIDANQNGPGRTIASVYSVRPRPGAPVSTPVEWDELTPELTPEDFTMEVVLGRIADRGDLYAAVLEDRQALGPALRNL